MTETAAQASTADDLRPEPVRPPDFPRPRRWWQSRPLRWLTAIVLVLALVAATVLVLLAAAGAQQSDDPRSSQATGSAALAQLLQDEGVRVRTTDQVTEAARDTDQTTTLVVANADRLSAADGQRLLTAPHARLVLLRPNTTALRAFALDVTATSPTAGTFDPGCPNEAAQRAGSVLLDDMRASYQPASGVELACYPTSAGFAQVRVRSQGTLVDLVAGGFANDTMAAAGNAAFATSLLGSQPKVLWLMAPQQAAASEGGAAPTLLPGWWQLALVQAFVAVTVLAVWRGRRLGPILVEPLPVSVRASETVEGHGRLYQRIGARDRAAAGLRGRCRARLGRTFGHADDVEQLAVVVAGRTGQDVRSVQHLLDGPPPETDDDLLNLAMSLDQLEQEASRL